MKVKERIAKAKSTISIRIYKRPLIYIIVLMVLINLFVLIVAAFIALMIDSSYSSFIDAFANGSVKWMLSPNAILTIENPQTLALAVGVLITGLILFSGTIIALTTNAIKDYVQKKNSGSGKINLDYHVVILNWNSKVPELVSDLLFVESSDVTVIILADIDKDYAEKQIVNAIEKTNHQKNIKRINVLVKSGDPLLRTNLEDISIENAKAILIMNPDQHESVIKDMTKSDLFVIKNVLSLGPIEFVNKPPIVVEIKHIETKEKIVTLGKVVKTLHEHDIMPICFDRRLGQIIAQTLIENHIEDVYLSLFSFKGSEVYALKNVSFDECLKEHSHAIPLAEIDGKLFVLSPNNAIKNKRSSHQFKPLKLKTSKLNEKTDLSIYIIGKNNKLQFILDSFKQYELIHGSRFHATWIDENELEKLVNQLNQTQEKSTILLLSHEDQVEDSLDANVIHNLIFIEGKLTNKNTHIIVELLNPKNDIIVKGFSINNTIISNKIISLLLSKLALFEETAPFYEELLTIAPNENNQDNQSITIHEAKTCIKEKFPIVFESRKQLAESIYQSFNKQYMIIGYFRNQSLIILEGDLHMKEICELHEDDLLVMIKL
ncbi:hypothetical protein [Peloplasma aerotolerans]|uniref:Potassium transporter TrkA n=1 Tax=Peloplasma aerotolerans TaxID=3044389 RepID=A0AAW6U5W0_9MOLU|nr:hypothetical protein [Mariniplasma sp. M4Ah]MDI6453366.1 hypothetical protein [Mariniplasma sp. M4Ah]